MTNDQKWEHIFAIVGACVPLISALASLINHIVRKKLEAGEKVSPMLTGTGSVLNLAAVNVDKAIQFAKLARSSGLLPAAAAAATAVADAAQAADPKAAPPSNEPPKA